MRHDRASFVEIDGAREHNLKNVDLRLQKGRMIVLTGPSGSGKTSLAFDTVAAESAYRLALFAGTAGPGRPAVRAIRNLPPVIAIERRPPTGSRASLASFLDLDEKLFELSKRALRRPCVCGGEIRAFSRKEILDDAFDRFNGRLVAVSREIRLEEHDLSRLAARGRTRLVAEEKEIDIEESPGGPPDSGTAGLVLDRLSLGAGQQGRFLEALAQPLERGGSILISAVKPGGNERPTLARYSETGACPTCGRKGLEITRALYDFEIGDPTGPVSGGAISALLPFARLAEDERSELLLQEIGGVSVSRLLSGELGELHGALPSGEPLTGLIERLARLGLSHLRLSRPMATLSLGERQRAHLGKQLFLEVPGVAYVIDEPTLGLHPADTVKLIDCLRDLRGRGHTLLLTEHDRDVIAAADEAVIMGPGAGALGGEIVAQGSPGEVLSRLPGPRPLPSTSREPSGKLSLSAFSARNIENLSTEIPLGMVVAICGVSGSGKSSLVMEGIVPAIRKALDGGGSPAAQGIRQVVIASYAGRRAAHGSMVATLSGLFEPLRELFAVLPLSRRRGYSKSTFSLGTSPFSMKCRTCGGTGRSRHGMVCPECSGRRYERPALDVRFKGFDISEILEMRCGEALELLSNIPRCREALTALGRFQLDYLVAGQPAGSLSDGELQRVRLARDLAKQRSGCLYVFEEPSAGLDAAQVANLSASLHGLADAGSSVIAIEHNLDFLQSADYIIEMGPGPGREGGRIVFSGHPAGLRGSGTATGAALERQ